MSSDGKMIDQAMVGKVPSQKYTEEHRLGITIDGKSLNFYLLLLHTRTPLKEEYTLDEFKAMVGILVNSIRKVNIRMFEKKATRENKNLWSLVDVEFLGLHRAMTGLGFKFTKDVQELVDIVKLLEKKRITNTITIEEALMKMMVGRESASLIAENIEAFQSFGSSTSHTLRDALFKMFDKDKLDPNAIFFVYFFAALIKNKARIESSLSKMAEAFVTHKPVSEARTFINKRLCQYTNEEVPGTKFAIVHLPTTFPGMDIYCWLSVTQSRTLEAFYERSTAAQIFMTPECIAKCKEAQKNFWLEKVKTTNNDGNKDFVPTFREDFFNTSANDTYSFIDIDSDGTFFEVMPANAKIGYTEEEVKSYIASVKTFVPEEE